MNAPLRQAERLGRLTTALGPDVLTVLRFDGQDYLNELFEYRVEALAMQPDLDFDALVGTHATVEIHHHGAPQHFDGIVTQARWLGRAENGHRYDLMLRPWFWLAGRRRNQRIFHNKTVVEILGELFADYAGLGEPAVENALTQDYPKLEYTVQYRESDLAFARRQMERHGISFHFRHRPGTHTLVLTDDVLAHPSIGQLPYYPGEDRHQRDHEHLWDWLSERNVTTGAIRLTDYNFKQPDQAMETWRLGDAVHPQGQIESYDYPGDYASQGAGNPVAGLRTGQERGGDRRIRAAGDCASLRAGRRFVLAGDPAPGRGSGFICLSSSVRFTSEAYGTGTQGDLDALSGTYVLMPDTAPLAPPRRTPAPLISGPQTATVVGEGEIDCDDYGRILVRFHWDIANAISMRCRVSQNWAGPGWGGMVIPRIGMEVVVEFLEGDPDKPLVVGNVFNGRNGAPYGLPAAKTKMVLRSQTHQGKGFNELSFEDQSGSEEIFMHGQKDHRVQINNDQNQSIGNDRSKTVGNNQSESVGNDKSINVGNNHSETIKGNKSMSVSGDHAETITGNKTLGVTGDHAETVKGAMSVTVTGDRAETVKASRNLTVTADDSTTVEQGSQSVTVKTGSRHVSVLAAGQYTTAAQDIITVSKGGSIALKAATSVVIEAPSILLKADASNFIQIGGGQLIIEGAETYINPRETAPDTGALIE